MRKVIYHGKTYEVWNVSSKGKLILGERREGYYGLFITHYGVKPEDVEVMKSMSRKALRLASEYSNRQYKVSREIANELGIVHKPRWRQFTITSRRYRKFMYGQLGPIGINAGGYKQ